MTDLNTTADIIPLRKQTTSAAEREAAKLRQRACRARKAARDNSAPKLSRDKTEPKLSRAVTPVTPVTKAKPVTSVTSVTPVTDRVTAAHHAFAPVLLQAASVGLALVGITMNGWFARSLGSSDIAGWLFLGIGIAADACALALPTCAAKQWRAHSRGAAVAGWLVWLATLAFALTAGIGFASVNISDVTTARAGHVTPAVTTAQDALRDAQGARDRECKGGVGKFCREREAAVTAARADLDKAMAAVEAQADPQVQAAIDMMSWLSHGTLAPSPKDFAMLRLVLLALLPQLGGILLMVARPAKGGVA